MMHALPALARPAFLQRPVAALALAVLLPAAMACAQAPAPSAPAPAAAPPAQPGIERVPAPGATPQLKPGPPLELASLAWLDGCWAGEVGQYAFREHWLPLRGGMMLGAGHVVAQGKTEDYGFLKLETRPDGVYYVSIASDRKELSFRLAATAVDDRDTVFTFVNPADVFPQRVVYRRGSGGWLYASVEGKVQGQDKQVVYPMQRVDCQGGEPLRK